MFLPNMLLVCRFQIVVAKRRDFEERSKCYRVMLMSTWVCKQWASMPSQETVEFDMTGLHVEHNVAIAGMVRCAESCWRSDLYMQEREERTSSQPRIGADFVAQLWHCTEGLTDWDYYCHVGMSMCWRKRCSTQDWLAPQMSMRYS